MTCHLCLSWAKRALQGEDGKTELYRVCDKEDSHTQRSRSHLGGQQDLTKISGFPQYLYKFVVLNAASWFGTHGYGWVHHGVGAVCCWTSLG